MLSLPQVKHIYISSGTVETLSSSITRLLYFPVNPVFSSSYI